MSLCTSIAALVLLGFGYFSAFGVIGRLDEAGTVFRVAGLDRFACSLRFARAAPEGAVFCGFWAEAIRWRGLVNRKVLRLRARADKAFMETRDEYENTLTG